MYYYDYAFDTAAFPYRYYPVEYNQQLIQDGHGDERFFGFGILPFVAGLAIAPLLFNNRPCCPPYPPPYAYPPPAYPQPYGYPPPYAYPQNIPPQAYNTMQGSVNDTINIYTQ